MRIEWIKRDGFNTLHDLFVDGCNVGCCYRSGPVWRAVRYDENLLGTQRAECPTEEDARMVLLSAVLSDREAP